MRLDCKGFAFINRGAREELNLKEQLQKCKQNERNEGEDRRNFNTQ